MAPKGRGRSKLPAPLPADMVLRDTEGNAWRLGRQLGQGGFGLIYLASSQTHVPVEDDAVHVIKVEYLENGPLFSEVKFYQRAAKQVHIRKWMHLKNIKCLGIPVYWGSGLAEYRGKSYRFMVMERLGQDLQSIFEDSGSRFKKTTVLQLGARMLDALEYIHENEYVHCDIKAANLLLGYTNPHEVKSIITNLKSHHPAGSESCIPAYTLQISTDPAAETVKPRDQPSQDSEQPGAQTGVYLADYGLSYRYCPNGNHKQYQENPRKGHNGTIEFTSLDAHKGVAPSRRGDLEILGYCMLQWLCGKLPWEQNLKDPVAVQTAKTKFLDELPHSVMEWESSGSKCSEIAKFLACVYGLAYDEKPKYEVLKKVLLDGLESSGTRYDGPLEFSTAGCAPYHSASKMPKVHLPKPVLKPVQLKQKRMEDEDYVCQNKTCAGAMTSRDRQDEEKPVKSITLHHGEAPHVCAAKPALKAAEQKLSEMKVDDLKSSGGPCAPVMRRKPQAREKPLELKDMTEQPEGQQRYMGRELHPQAVFWEDKHLAAAEVVPLQENLSGIPGSCTSGRSGLAFTGQIYCYSAIIVVLLLLISLSLYFL